MNVRQFRRRAVFHKHASKNWRNDRNLHNNAFQTNTAMMRCLTKAISCTGIGLLQLYANEGLPLDEDGIDEFLDRIAETKDMQELQQVYAEAYNATKKDKEANKLLTTAKDKRKGELNA